MELWWQPIEYDDFKIEATAEVTEMMKKRNVDLKRAIKILYSSPSHFYFDEPLDVGSPVASPTAVSDPSPHEGTCAKSINFLLLHSQTIDPKDHKSGGSVPPH